MEFPCEACVRKPFRTYKELVTHCIRMGDRVHLESVFSESNSDEWVACKVEGCEYRASRIDFHLKKKHGMTREQYKQRYSAPVLSKKFIERVSNSGRHANDGKDMSGENNPFFGRRHSDESRKRISERTRENNALLEQHFNKGLVRSEETRKKMSKAKTGEKNPLYGKRKSSILKRTD